MSDFLKHYKHKTISRFSVGPYHFVNHILEIDSEEKNDDFLREVSGLLMVDQINITEIMNLENERPLDLSQRVSRGMLGTAGVKLQDSTAEGKSAELTRREQELNAREAIIAAQERRIPGNAPLPAADESPAPASTEGEAPAADPATAPATDPAPVKVGGLVLGNRQ